MLILVPRHPCAQSRRCSLGVDFCFQPPPASCRRTRTLRPTCCTPVVVLLMCAGSVGFTRRAGATRYTHGSISDMLQQFPASISALDPAWQQQAQQGQQPAPSPGEGGCKGCGLPSTRPACARRTLAAAAEAHTLLPKLLPAVPVVHSGLLTAHCISAASPVSHRLPPLRSLLQGGLVLMHRVAPIAMPAGVTALVFGREESGLTEAELRLCAHACAIPTGRMQASMNLSHAVAVVLSGLFERRLGLLGFTENPGLDTKGGRAGRQNGRLRVDQRRMRVGMGAGATGRKVQQRHGSGEDRL